MSGFKKYRSHKIVEAAVIAGIASTGAKRRTEVNATKGLNTVRIEGEVVEVDPKFFGRGFPEPGDYLVRYEDGYLSWSPKKAFEEGYTEFPDSVLMAG